MENLHKIARGYYNAGTETTKMEAQSLFRKMDTNGDGKVNLFELKNYMKGDEKRMKKYFDVVDFDGSGDLDFSEAVTFYYLLTVGRPECGNCHAVLLDTYFTCVTCFSNANNSFDLCTHCYSNTDRNHQHNNFSDINSLVSSQGNSIPGTVYGSNMDGLSNGLQMAGNIVRVGEAAVKIHQFLAEPSTSSSSQLPDVSPELPSQLPDVSPELPSQLPDVLPELPSQLPDVSQDDTWELADIGQSLVEAVCSLM